MRLSPRLAYFSPLPPQRTGIADYSAELLPYLARHAELTLFADDPAEVDAALQRQFTIQPIAAFAAQRRAYDLALYQMGNSSDFHQSIYRTLLRYPGLVVLHDYVLHHFMVGCTVAQGDTAGYVREMGYALGSAGMQQARAIAQGSQPFPWYDVPLNERLLDVSLGVMVHSRYVEGLIHQRSPHIQTAVISQPMQPVEGCASRRSALPWPADAIIFASLGQITPAKQIDQALRALARLRRSLPQARLLLVGEVMKEGVDLKGLIRQLGLEDAVHCTGFVGDLQAFAEWTNAADVVVNLRYPTTGETSATALRAMAAGRPVIVSDHGWYAELPDEACCKVPVNDERALYAAMRRLATDVTLRRNLGQMALRYVREQCNVERVAAQYMAFVERILAQAGR